MNTTSLLKWRYATKQFDPSKIITPDKLQIIKEAFNLTATSYGLQPIKLLIVRTKEIKEQLKAAAFNQSQVTDASDVLVFCIDTEIDALYVEDYFKLVKEKRNTPEEILKPFREFLINHFEVLTQDEKLNWATKQAYLAMGNLLTVCAIEQIDACPMEGFSPEKTDEILELKKQNLKSVLLMPIGYRSEDDFMASLQKVRKPLEEMIITK
ncbi:NAD(P)H-dependent oxidoreductase [Corallibacter sp.]|uniref:NAD(P)H-dependent oxidoreductase n=1 Tax=Corallibacter sp. TaxID=2038084 RepID=UPI003A94F7D2